MTIGTIYKIVHNDIAVYVGSTFKQLKQRWWGHRGSYRRFVKNDETIPPIYQLFDEHGIENFDIVLIKTYDVVDIQHLRAYEQLHINKLADCVNVTNPIKIPYLASLEKKKYNRDYNKIHRAELNQKAKSYYQENKQRYEKYKAPVLCECGTLINGNNLIRHRRSTKHKSLIASS